MSLGKVLVTGSNRGLGKHLMNKFVDHGYEIIHHGGKEDYDLRDVDQVKRLAFDARELGVSILVNNAGINGPQVAVED